MRVLIVEDDSALGLFLQKGLILEGHDVEWFQLIVIEKCLLGCHFAALL